MRVNSFYILWDISLLKIACPSSEKWWIRVILEKNIFVDIEMKYMMISFQMIHKWFVYKVCYSIGILHHVPATATSLATNHLCCIMIDVVFKFFLFWSFIAYYSFRFCSFWQVSWASYHVWNISKWVVFSLQLLPLLNFYSGNFYPSNGWSIISFSSMIIEASVWVLYGIPFYICGAKSSCLVCYIVL